MHAIIGCRERVASQVYDRIVTRSATVVVLLASAITLAMMARGTAEGSSSCSAQRVSGGVVKVGPFRGMIVPQYDVVDGRFRLHVGGYRDKATGLTQKIPWFVPMRAGSRPRLLVTGTRLSPSRRSFRQRLGRAEYPGQDQERRYIYPSNISPPAAGCWRLRFQSGTIDAHVIVLVRNS
jgi:hypothetical protein